MIILKETRDIELIKSIISVPEIWKLTYGQVLKSIDDFKLEEHETYLAIYKDLDLVGIYTYHSFTNVTVEVHTCMLPQYWGTKLSHEAVLEFYKHLKEKGYITAITSIPACCEHTLKFMANLKCDLVGVLKNGIVFNNHLQTLFIFEKDLRN